MYRIIISISAMLLMGSLAYAQTKEIYTNPNFERISRSHKTLAILPFKTIIKLRPKEQEKLTEKEYQDLLVDEGLAVQSALETYFLKSKRKYNFRVKFQDISKTNALLKQNGISQENIESMTPEQYAQILEVDGIISGILSTNKPMSEGASAALGILFGFYGSTNSGKCTINISDGDSGELVWKYEKTLSRSLGSDTNTVINAMMRKAARKFPYNELSR